MYDLDLFLKMPRKVQELFWNDIDGIINEEISFKPGVETLLARYQFDELSKCESPIEQILMAYFDRTFRDLEHFSDYGYFLIPQVCIECGTKTYRVDFIALFREMQNINDKWVEKEKFLVVECDGHDFHEKTKAQVKKRNERDYDLKMVGLDVVHFSGSEIYNNPQDCVDKIKNLLDIQPDDKDIWQKLIIDESLGYL